MLSLLAQQDGQVCVCDLEAALPDQAADGFASPAAATRSWPDRLRTPRPVGLLFSAARGNGRSTHARVGAALQQLGACRLVRWEYLFFAAHIDKLRYIIAEDLDGTHSPAGRRDRRWPGWPCRRRTPSPARRAVRCLSRQATVSAQACAIGAMCACFRPGAI